VRSVVRVAPPPCAKNAWAKNDTAPRASVTRTASGTAPSAASDAVAAGRYGASAVNPLISPASSWCGTRPVAGANPASSGARSRPVRRVSASHTSRTIRSAGRLPASQCATDVRS